MTSSSNPPGERASGKGSRGDAPCGVWSGTPSRSGRQPSVPLNQASFRADALHPQWKRQVPKPCKETPPFPPQPTPKNAEAAFNSSGVSSCRSSGKRKHPRFPYRNNADAEVMGLSDTRAAYSYSTTSAHFSSSSRSSGLPLRDWLAATMGIHFCTYCLAVSLFLQKRFRYFSASSCRPSRENSR